MVKIKYAATNQCNFIPFRYHYRYFKEFSTIIFQFNKTRSEVKLQKLFIQSCNSLYPHCSYF